MSDVLQEMAEAVKAMEATIPSENSSNQEKAQAAENALLRHLALEGELALRRDQLAAEHQRVTERLIQARQHRPALVEAVQQAGGQLPIWEV